MVLTKTGLRCPECRGTVQLADLGHICPMCGTRLADALDLQAIDVATGLIAADVVCAQCQYNLRTIPAGSVCPECGTPAVQSLTRDELRWVDPKWLDKTRRGLGTLAFTLVLALGSSLFRLCQLWGFQQIPPNAEWLISFAFFVAYTVPLCLGCIQVTHRESAGQPRPLLERRRLLRILVFAATATCLAMWFYPLACHAWLHGFRGLRGDGLLEAYAATGTGPLNVALRIAYLATFQGTLLLLILVIRTLAVRARRTPLRKSLSVTLGLSIFDATVGGMVLASSLALQNGTSTYAYWVWYQICFGAERALTMLVSVLLLLACLRLRRRLCGVLQGRMGPSPA